MPRFSANLGFLWKDLHLPDAIRAAKAAGFDAVECHAPFATPGHEVISALSDTGLPMLGINTGFGKRDGDMGLAAVPGRETEAQDLIGQALDYAADIKATSVHVLSGRATGGAAETTLLTNLEAAAEAALDRSITILIEPLNAHDAPGYFLNTTNQARRIIDTLNHPSVKLMFDCYHVGRSEGDIVPRMSDLLAIIGHIQFAGVPDRGPPDHGVVDYAEVFEHVDQIGWTRPIGAEYRPPDHTEASLDWMQSLT